MRVMLGSLFLLLVAASGAVAGSAPARPASSHQVALPILIAPMTEDGRLTGYAYLNPVLTAASDQATLKVRDRTPFLQDAFVRDVNAASIQDPANPKQVDIKGLEARLLADARRIMGPANVTAVAFSQIQISALLPGMSSAPASQVPAPH